MNVQRFGKTWDLALRNNLGLLVSNLGLVTISAVLAIRMATSHERVILTPPHLDQRMEVAWREASAEYFKAFGLYAANMIGNITPRSATFVADALSMIMAPRVYAPVRNQILALAEDPNFQRANSFNFFTPSEVLWEAGTSKVFVPGVLTVSSFNAALSGPAEIKSVIYEFEFEMQQGRPMIIGFDSYPGTQPHTLRWIETNPPAEHSSMRDHTQLLTRAVPESDETTTPGEHKAGLAPGPAKGAPGSPPEPEQERHDAAPTSP